MPHRASAFLFSLILCIAVVSLAYADPVCAEKGRARICRDDNGTVRTRVGDQAWREQKPVVKPEAPPRRDPHAADVASLTPDLSSEMTVLVVYTAAARTRAGGDDAIRATAQLAVDLCNQNYAKASPGVSLRLAGAYLTSYIERGDLGADLTWLLSDSTIATERDRVSADLVHLLSTSSNNGSTCGLGYLTASPQSAFSVTWDACSISNLSFCHELGHNQGLHHDRANASGTAATPYAYGFRTGAFRCVMSYPDGSPRLNHHSSPLYTVNGIVSGTASEDNARTLIERAPLVAAFRGGTSTPTPTPKPCKGRKCR